MNNFHFDVADIEGGTTLLGRDFLRFNRVLISYSRKTLFIQPAASAHATAQAEPATGATGPR